jgi:hypothetical protein
VNEDDYRQNLTDIVTYCRKRGIHVVFLLLRDNPIDAEPVRSGVSLLRKDDLLGAIRSLTAALDRERALGLGDLARLYMAEAYRRLGEAQKADRIPRVTYQPEQLQLDGQNPVRLDSSYNDIMRAVATAEGATLVDGASVLESIPGVFSDVCHFNEEGHRRIGKLLANRILGLWKNVLYLLPVTVVLWRASHDNQRDP